MVPSKKISLAAWESSTYFQRKAQQAASHNPIVTTVTVTDIVKISFVEDGISL
ncbi:MAG: hypothetical protein K2H96_08390 [Muribaculaceae bacterium]|nr:hypothetical protein [Muribaculaceae bacterium]